MLHQSNKHRKTSLRIAMNGPDAVAVVLVTSTLMNVPVIVASRLQSLYLYEPLLNLDFYGTGSSRSVTERTHLSNREDIILTSAPHPSAMSTHRLAALLIAIASV